MTNIVPQDVLRFWFDEVTKEQRFKKNSEFDRLIDVRFGKAVRHALDGGFEDWEGSAEGRLALIILLDQFTRNIFRDTPEAFSGDARAMRLSERCVAEGDLEASTDMTWRIFALMPYMHSEEIAVQEAGLHLFEKFTDENTLDYAKRHRDIIAKWGRYPHRNATVGRESTPAELAFLEKPGSSF